MFLVTQTLETTFLYLVGSSYKIHGHGDRETVAIGIPDVLREDRWMHIIHSFTQPFIHSFMQGSDVLYIQSTVQVTGMAKP